MSDWIADKRTQTVLSVLLRIESLVSSLTRVAIAKLSSQALNSLMTEAKKIVTYDHDLGQMGSGLSRWPLPDANANLPTFLRGMNQIVSGLEAFRGSSHGLTDKGKQLVDNHFSLLAQVRQAAEFAISNPEDGHGTRSRLEDASTAMQRQIVEARSLSLDGQSDPW